MKELIIVKQLPIIEEKLKQISDEIDVKTTNVLSLVCNEDTVKEIKTLRANLNKDYKTLEEQRKAVKSQVLAPYEAFEDIYKKYVSDKFKTADNELKSKIDDVEGELKAKKEEQVKTYFNEYLISKNIDFITYEMANVNVTLSASLKSLKEQAKAFIDKVSDDLTLINTQKHKDEILFEYKRTLNVSQAITTVSNRVKAIEAEKARLTEIEQIKVEEIKAIEKVDALLPPEEESEEVESELFIAFKVYGNIEELKKVKEFLENGGFKYEQI